MFEKNRVILIFLTVALAKCWRFEFNEIPITEHYYYPQSMFQL